MKKKHDILVLNRNFVPIHIISWQKAMSLIIQDSARSLDRDVIAYDFSDWLLFSEKDNDYAKVATVRYNIAVPEIVVLKKYDRLPTRDVKYSRQTLFERDGHICGYCGMEFDKKHLTIDHITPRAQGGKTTWANTISACFQCNNKKADKTPEQAGMPLKYKPRKPGWFSPLTHIKPDHPCKSWFKFMSKV